METTITIISRYRYRTETHVELNQIDKINWLFYIKKNDRTIYYSQTTVLHENSIGERNTIHGHLARWSSFGRAISRQINFIYIERKYYH